MRACKVDKNQGEIVSAYRAMGFSIVDTSRVGQGFSDLVVGKFGRTYLVEVKTLTGAMEKTQRNFKKEWRGCYRVVRTLDDVIKHAKEALKDHEQKA